MLEICRWYGVSDDVIPNCNIFVRYRCCLER